MNLRDELGDRTELRQLFNAHVGITFPPSHDQLLCTCGVVVWTLPTGVIADDGMAHPGQTVGEAAHAAHLTDVIGELLDGKRIEATSILRGNRR